MTFPGNQTGVRGVAFSPDGQTVAAGDAGVTISRWNRDGSQHRVLSGHHVPVQTVAFSPDGHTLISGDSDGVIKL